MSRYASTYEYYRVQIVTITGGLLATGLFSTIQQFIHRLSQNTSVRFALVLPP